MRKQLIQQQVKCGQGSLEMLYSLAMKFLSAGAIIVFIFLGCSQSQSDISPPTDQPVILLSSLAVGMTYEHKVDQQASISIVGITDDGVLMAGIGIDGSYMIVPMQPQEFLDWVVDDTLWQVATLK